MDRWGAEPLLQPCMFAYIITIRAQKAGIAGLSSTIDIWCCCRLLCKVVTLIFKVVFAFSFFTASPIPPKLLMTWISTNQIWNSWQARDQLLTPELICFPPKVTAFLKGPNETLCAFGGGCYWSKYILFMHFLKLLCKLKTSVSHLNLFSAERWATDKIIT